MAYPFELYYKLPANASRYDLYRGTPDPADQQWMWAVWSAVSLAGALSSGVVALAILRSREARGFAFNLYLVALAIPDIIFGLSCTITCALNHHHMGYVSVAMCDWCGSLPAAQGGGATPCSRTGIYSPLSHLSLLLPAQASLV